MLGYLFNTSDDSLKLSDFTLGTVNSKRQLLSEISKIFDPLSLFFAGNYPRSFTDEEDMGKGDELG